MLTLKQIQLVGLRCRNFIEDEIDKCFCCTSEPQCFAGACAIASHAMSIVLDEHGHDTTFVLQSIADSLGFHCYLEFFLDDIKHVVDATATQFFCGRYKEDDDWSQYIAECVVEPAKAYRKRQFCTGRRTIDMKALHTIKRGWQEQSPHNYEKKIIAWADRACRGLEDIGSDVQARYGRDKLTA